jgi:hypothetical protein
MLRVEEGRLTAERLAVIRDAINSAPTGSYSFAAALSLLAHIDAVTAERDLYDQRLAAAAVVLEAFERSLGVEIGRQLDGNFTTRNP